jgi:hypothetical protein
MMPAPDPRPAAPARASHRAASAWATLAIAVALVAWPSARAAAQAEPTVTAKAAPLKVAAGDQGTLKVTIVIAKGYALVAPPQPTKYATTLAVILSAGDGLVPLGPVYPEGKSITEEDATTYGTYEGTITVKVPVKVAPGTAAGTRLLKGKLRYQPMRHGQFLKAAVMPLEFAVEVAPAKKTKTGAKPKPAEPPAPAEPPKTAEPSTRR